MYKARIQFLVVLVAIGGLFFGCNQSSGSEAGTADTGGTSGTSANSGLSIVYIHSDSLQAGYTALATELERLQENFNKAQENIGAESAALQREAQQLQNKMQQGLLSPNQVQSEQQRLARKDQEIRQRSELVVNSIQEEQFQLQAVFTQKVKEILDELRTEKSYDFILTQGAGSSVLMANEAYDITDLVLERLNASGEDSLSADSTATDG